MGFLSGLLSVAAPIAGAVIGGPLGAGIGAGISAGANAIGAGENNKNQQNLLKQQIEAQQQLQKDQNDWNEQMWNKQNEYNNPANQRQLYEEAGLNPAYFLGEGKSTAGSVGANTISAPSVPTPAGNFQGLGSISDVAQLALIDSQIKVNESKAGLNTSQQKTNEDLREWEVKYKKALAGKTEEEISEVQAMTDKIKADESYVKALKVLTETKKEQLDLIIKWMPILNQAQLDEVGARIRMYMSQAHKDDVQAALAPVFAMAYKKIADAAGKQADAAMMNAETNQKVGDSIVRVNDSQVKVNDSQVGVNNANAAYIKSKTKGQDIQNDVDEATAGAKKFQQNVEGYGGTCIDMLDKLWNTGSKVFSDVVTGGGTAILRNGGSHSNPASYKVGYTQGYQAGSTDNDSFWGNFK